MRVNGGAYSSIEEVRSRVLKSGGEKKPAQAAVQDKSFAEILSERQGGSLSTTRSISFSKHAAERLSDRNIHLSESQLNRLSAGVNRAGEKGISDSLVMVDNLAFIVNTDSNTVITAMDAAESEGNVFSHIDGAVIA